MHMDATDQAARIIDAMCLPRRDVAAALDISPQQLSNRLARSQRNRMGDDDVVKLRALALERIRALTLAMWDAQDAVDIGIPEEST